jgi:hypothetical protein
MSAVPWEPPIHASKHYISSNRPARRGEAGRGGTDFRDALKVMVIAVMFAIMGVGIAWVFERLSPESQLVQDAGPAP